jgi:hypothetical protein
MQNFILPDYLDGTKIDSKNINLFNLYLVSQLTPYMRIMSDLQVEIRFEKGEHPEIEGIPLDSLVPIIRHDESMKVFLRALKGYRENPSKNYIFTKDLTTSLKNTKLDVRSKYLPKKFSAFIEMKGLFDHEGEEIKGFFVDIKSDPNHFIYLGFVNFNHNLNSYTISHLNIPLEDSERPLSELIKDYQYVCRGVDKEMLKKWKTGENICGNPIIEEYVQQGEYYDHFHAVFNAIIYITNPQEDMIEESNIFSDKKSKRDTQKKIYTPKNFIILGKNFKNPKEYTCGEIGVSGHWRWQPYGPARSLLKRIFIKPHTRNYNNKLSDTEVVLES